MFDKVLVMRYNGYGGLMNYRIITDSHRFKVQYRQWWNPIWLTIQRPEDLDNKDFGGDKSFSSKAEAQKYMDDQVNKNKWTVVR